MRRESLFAATITPCDLLTGMYCTATTDPRLVEGKLLIKRAPEAVWQAEAGHHALHGLVRIDRHRRHGGLQPRDGEGRIRVALPRVRLPLLVDRPARDAFTPW